MDSFWQQHRKFILKIAAGLLVVLVCYIIGSSLTERSLDDIRIDVASAKSRLRMLEIPPPEAIRSLSEALGVIARRIGEVAGRVGETRQGDEVPAQVCIDILGMIDRDTEANRESYRRDAARPVGLIVKLFGEAKQYLQNLAGPADVQIPKDIGDPPSDFEAADAGRYLMALRLVVRVVKVAIEERVSEVKAIGIGVPSAGRFETEQQFLREYPVNLTVRGPSASVLRLIERLNDPAAFVPLKTLRQLKVDTSGREEEVTAEFEFAALHIDKESEIGK